MTLLLMTMALLTAGYFLAMVFIAGGIEHSEAPKEKDTHKVSIIVAVRNEEKNIPVLMSSLLSQDYPADMYEIVIVDDASADATPLLLAEYTRHIALPKLTIIKSQGREKIISPKKHALTQGIAHATGDILLFTDADCLPPHGWVRSMVSYFNPKTGMVIGFSPLEIPGPHSLSSFFQAIESLALAALACGTSGWGRPATCSGRNLAYRKSVFHQVGGFAEIMQYASGDDDLLLKLVVNKTQWQIAYAFHPSAIVPTRSVSRFGALIQQRLRHASKGLKYGWKMSAVLALVYIYNLLMLVSLTGLFFSFSVWPLLFLFAKTVGELILLGSFALPMARSRYLFFLPVAAIIHLPYVVLFGAFGPLIKIKWKPQSPVLKVHPQ